MEQFYGIKLDGGGGIPSFDSQTEEQSYDADPDDDSYVTVTLMSKRSAVPQFGEIISLLNSNKHNTRSIIESIRNNTADQEKLHSHQEESINVPLTNTDTYKTTSAPIKSAGQKSRKADIVTDFPGKNSDGTDHSHFLKLMNSNKHTSNKSESIQNQTLSMAKKRAKSPVNVNTTFDDASQVTSETETVKNESDSVSIESPPVAKKIIRENKDLGGTKLSISFFPPDLINEKKKTVEVRNELISPMNSISPMTSPQSSRRSFAEIKRVNSYATQSSISVASSKRVTEIKSKLRNLEVDYRKNGLKHAKEKAAKDNANSNNAVSSSHRIVREIMITCFFSLAIWIAYLCHRDNQANDFQLRMKEIDNMANVISNINAANIQKLQLQRENIQLLEKSLIIAHEFNALKKEEEITTTCPTLPPGNVTFDTSSSTETDEDMSEEKLSLNDENVFVITSTEPEKKKKFVNNIAWNDFFIVQSMLE